MSNPEKTAQPGSSWKSMLLARPVWNSAARVQEGESGTVTVRIKREKPWYLFAPISWIVPLRPWQELALDPIGSGIWRLCDGRQTVEAIVDDFARQYRLTFHEARVAVTAYLKTLIQRGALAIALPGQDGRFEEREQMGTAGKETPDDG